MRFKDRIKGLDPIIFEVAAERLASGADSSGCCLSILRAVRERNNGDIDGFSKYTTLLNEFFMPEDNRNLYYFGAIAAYAGIGGGYGWEKANAHRIQSLLLLAEMIRYARR